MSETGTETKKDPIIVRRYQNRKLYDTAKSAYVTLHEIAKMIRDGIDVVVIDNKSKKDITSSTLVQILFETEKKSKKVLPISTMREVIQIGGGSLSKFVQKSFQSGVESLSSAKAEAEKALETIVGKTAGLTLPDIQKLIDQKLKSKLGKVIPQGNHQKLIQELNDRINSLEKKIIHYEKLLEEKNTKTS